MKRELTYLIQFKILTQPWGGVERGEARKEITVIRMLSDNVKYEILKLHLVMDPISNMKKLIPSGTYAGRQLLSMLEGMVELN